MPPGGDGDATTLKKGSYPSKITSFTARPGPKAGQISLKWKLAGKVSEGLVVETAITSFSPFSNDLPRKGKKWQKFSFPGSTRSAVLTREQTAQAGAPLGSGLHLIIRTYNRGTSKGKPVKRWYGPAQASAARGLAPVGRGSRLRVATYNIRLDGLDRGDLAWRKRMPRVARMMASRRPAIIGVNELVPRMWHGAMENELAKAKYDMPKYRLTRSTAVTKNVPMDARILYDKARLKMLSSCPEDRISCVVSYASAKNPTAYAPYSKFEVRATGEKFWFVNAHLDAGAGAAAESRREQQAAKIVARMNELNDQRLPVIFVGDINSAQSAGFDYRPHTVLRNAGYYDAAAATRASGLAYSTVSHFEAPKQRKSKRGFGARLDVILAKGMDGSSRFENRVIAKGQKYPSDHNMVLADLRLP